MRDLCRERSAEWSAGVAILWRRKEGRGSVLASFSLIESRKEACVRSGEDARRRVVVVIDGEGSFIVYCLCCCCGVVVLMVAVVGTSLG